MNIFFNKSEEVFSDLLSKFQMTNIMNKQFLFFFQSNSIENICQLIIIKNLSNLIDLILMKMNYETLDESKKKNSFSIYIINIYYYLNNDSFGEIDNKCKKIKKIDLELTFM
jgi:hypothetical protein